MASVCILQVVYHWVFLITIHTWHMYHSVRSSLMEHVGPYAIIYHDDIVRGKGKTCPSNCAIMKSRKKHNGILLEPLKVPVLIGYDIDGYVPCYSILTVICWGLIFSRSSESSGYRGRNPTGEVVCLLHLQEFLVICRVSIDIDVDIIHIYIYTFIYLFTFIYIYIYVCMYIYLCIYIYIYRFQASQMGDFAHPQLSKATLAVGPRGV